jgi:hypothetical protein
MIKYPHVPGPEPGQHPALDQLLKELRGRHGGAVEFILLYGSCLRSGDIFDGLLDLYLVVKDYSSAYETRRLAAGNWLLPPNVLYSQTEYEGQILRSKVTVISLEDFRRGCSRLWFQSYIWGRFAQPVRVIYHRDAASRRFAQECLGEAIHTLLCRALPCLPETGSVLELWEDALALSYATEIRTERSKRANELAHTSLEFFTDVSRLLSGSLPFPFEVYDSEHGPQYRCHMPAKNRRRGAIAWWLRRVQGKLLSIARLVKALFTFESGLDYIAWKLERHSGEAIEIPDNVRRYPLIFMWGFFWSLYRRGLFS